MDFMFALIKAFCVVIGLTCLIGVIIVFGTLLGLATWVAALIGIGVGALTFIMALIFWMMS